MGCGSVLKSVSMSCRVCTGTRNSDSEGCSILSIRVNLPHVWRPYMVAKMKTASFKCCTLIAGRLICCMYRHGCIAHTQCPHTLQTCCLCCTVLVAFCTLLQTQVQLGSATTLVLIRVQCQHMMSSWRLGSVTYAQESTYCKTGPLFAVLFSCYRSLVAILLLPFSCSQLATGDMTACQCQSQTQCLAVWKLTNNTCVK